MQNLRYIILFLIIIIFSNLGISSYIEGLDCPDGQKNENGKCISTSSQNSNNIYVVIILTIIVSFFLIAKRDY
jgi:hypothetical protein